MTEIIDEVRHSEPDYSSVKPKPSEYGDHIGVDWHMPFSTPWRDGTYELLRSEEDVAPTTRQLIGMRRTDGQARALYRLITLPIRSALKTSTFVPSEDGSAGGTKEAEFITNMFTLPPNAGGMEVTFQRVMSQILMGLFDGFAPFEQIYWSPKTGPLKGKITLQKLAYRPSETITFLTDQNGSFEGFRQLTSIHGKVVDVHIAPEDSFYWACQEEERPFYGISMFQTAFYHFDKKVKLYYVAHLAAQRNAVGTRVGTWPVNASPKEKLNFQKALADFGLSQFIAHPDNFKVEILKDGQQFDFLKLIDHHNSQMSKSVLASFFDQSHGGEKALVDFGKPSDELFVLMLQSIMDEIAAAINHYIIPKFIDWNFDSGKYPIFKWGSFTDEQKEAIRTTFDNLATGGQPNTTPDFLFELEKKMAEEMGLEIDYDKLQQERDAQKQLQQQYDQQAMSFGMPPGGAAPGGQPGAPAGPQGPPGPPGATPGGVGAPGPTDASAGPAPNGVDPLALSNTEVTLSLPLEELAKMLLIEAGENDE